MRNKNDSDSKRYFDWLFHANLDYLAATILKEDERCYPATTFHCQQCIEKGIKGYLLFKTKRLYDGHNLTWLCKQAMTVDKHFGKYLEDSVRLNKFYIETRYPADRPMEIDYDTTQHIFEMTTEMMDFICGEIRYDSTKAKIKND